ncbi:MAG: NADH-quinone oxidoreductase subunit C [Planctomycetes bacterium]|nr:NADH-quinone oxidoreductase subunit C [Planctomycetota bacterium]
MTPSDIIAFLQQHHAESVVSAVADGPYPHALVKAEGLAAVAAFLKTQPRLRFDLLRCISAIDWPAKNNIELAYDVISTSLGHAFAIKVVVDRADPRVESVSTVWPAAEWHEREAFDLMGVEFLHHPDLRRILMPEDWPGHPLRKDYQDIVEYRGLKFNP